MTDEGLWIERRARTYYAGMDAAERLALGRRIRRAIDHDGARRERMRRFANPGALLRRRPRDGPTEEQICTLFALSGPWSWQNIRDTDAERAIERLELERGQSTDRGAAVASVRAVLGLTEQQVRQGKLAGAIEAAVEAGERAVTAAAVQQTSERSAELSRLAGITARPRRRGHHQVSVPIDPSPIHEVATMDYQLRLIKVGGETRWAVHDGRRVVGKLFETYAQAAAERLRLDGLDSRSSASSSG